MGKNMSYARETSVPIGRSQEEIKRTLTKYKASGFAFGEQGDRAIVMFEMASRRIKFVLPIPIWGSAKNSKGHAITQKQVDQLARSRWRALLLAIKAKLECVETGITTLEQEFMAHIMLPNGSTVGDAMIPQIEKSYASGKMPPLLGYER